MLFVCSFVAHIFFFWCLNPEIHFLSLTDNVNIRDLFDFLSICFYEYEHFFKEFRSEIYLKVLILEMNYSIFIIILPQGGRADRPPPSCLRHRVQRHQEDLGVHQQQHDQLYCLNEKCHSSCIMYQVQIYFLVKCFWTVRQSTEQPTSVLPLISD